MKSSKRILAFNLAELITVISIIIILMNIIMPMLFKVREHGKNINCRANIKTIAAGVFTYANDFAGSPPYSSTFTFDYTPLIGSMPFNQALNSTAVGSILKKPASYQEAYLPWPKNRRSYGSGAASWPVDYSNIYACPSEPISWRCDLMRDASGMASSSMDTYYAWVQSHYNYILGTKQGVNLKASIYFWKHPAIKAMLGDQGYTSTASYYRGGNGNECQIYGRHFGTPIFHSPLAWNSSIGYRSHGQGKANWSMADGSILSWSWQEFYQRWRDPSNPGTVILQNPLNTYDL